MRLTLIAAAFVDCRTITLLATDNSIVDNVVHCFTDIAKTAIVWLYCLLTKALFYWLQTVLGMIYTASVI